LSIKSRKLFAILVIAMMMMTLLPVTAFAVSTNSVNKTPDVSVGTEFDDTDAPILRIEEKNTGEFSSPETFRLTLENAKWIKVNGDIEYGVDKYKEAKEGTILDVNVVSSTVAEITVGHTDASKKALFLFPLITEITGEGEATVFVESRGSAISSTSHVFANAAAGRTIASISKVVTFARTTGDELGDIQIDETRRNALGLLEDDEEQTITIKLPPRFTWEDVDDLNVEFTGGLRGNAEYADKVEGEDQRTLKITYTLYEGNRSAQGSIFLKGLKVRAERDATYGDVVVDIEGTNITSEELLIAKYTDYGVVADVKEVKEVVAGRHDNKTAKITIEENMTGALINNRELSVALPEWVKIVDLKNVKTAGEAVNNWKHAKNKNEIYFEIENTSTSTKSKYEFELELSIEADKSGDIVAEFFGAGMEKQELVIAKAVAPVTAEVAVTDLKIGVQNQEAPDIIITETAKSRIDNDTDVYTWTVGTGDDKHTYSAEGNENELVISLPSGIKFSKAPTVEVTEGNIELSPAKLVGGNLVIPIKSSSTRPSTIKITDVLLTLDRTVPEGAFNANIGGGSIVKNFEEDAVIEDPVTFDKDRVVRFHFANVITPAPGETRATTTFTIGSTNYTVVENNVAVEKTMDVAPYIKDGRTYLPVRYVADALGVTEDNILWDPVTRSVTIFKGDRIAQMTIDSTTLLVNGVEINMDVAPEITNGRTMLPVRWMTQALGAGIAWDAETQTVTVTQ